MLRAPAGAVFAEGRTLRSMKIAYITSCFGTQSHTFIRREIRALRNLGLRLSLYGVRRDEQSTAPDAEDLIAETRYLYPLSYSALLRSNLFFLFRSPLHYLKGLASAFSSTEFGLKRRAKMLYHYFAAAAVARDMLTQNVDHIHAHFMNVSASLAMYAAHHSKTPFSITVHSAGTFRTPHILGVHQKLSSAQFLLMISTYNIEYFSNIVPCREKSHVVRCGMELTEFDFRGNSKPQSNPARILAVGRFVEKKGFRYLIQACRELCERGVDFQLSLIGDGPLRRDLESEVVGLDLENIVNFTGPKSTNEVRAAMADADVVVVPSVTSASGEMEGLPVVIMEAMAIGVPVVASAHSGIPEIVRDGKTGYLTPEKDASAIAEAVQKTLQQPSAAMVADAYNLVSETFNVQHVAQQRLELFHHYHGSG